MAERRALKRLRRAGVGLLAWKKSLTLLAVFSIWFYFALPRLFSGVPFSPVLLDCNGQLLDARVAQDQQWRFPPGSQELPERYLQCLIHFEDRRFYWHPGIDPLAVARAVIQNVRGQDRVSGASTLSMQLIRIWRKAPRTWWNKIYEAILAVRLEFRYSKREILHLYSLHTPMGRNIVGAWSACWLYFGRPLNELSWAESALLAVLPNSPTALNPGKGRDRLKKKRDGLLNRLCRRKLIDTLTRDLAVNEDLPKAAGGLGERRAVHLLDTLHHQVQGSERSYPLYPSTIVLDLQQRAEKVLARHQQNLAKSRIHDLCALIVDHGTGQVLAYLGNAAYLNGGRDQSAWLDLVMCRRSTGSILKPFLYASMLQEGELTAQQLVEDIPTFIRGFVPQNFNRSYLGAVAAKDALAYSLNIPAVRLLQRHGLQRFYDQLKSMGMNTLQRPADGYGLTLILGGAEGTLWNMTELYSRLAQAALGNDRALALSALTATPRQAAAESWPIRSGAAWLTLQALTEVARPGLESHWQSFTSSRLLSWKTGTSHGFRDAWAMGVTPRHCLAVWVGNADGEGRPELSGLNVAAPVLFDLYQLVPAGEAFPAPWRDLKAVTLCRESGFLPGPNCHDTVQALLPAAAEYRSLCPFHERIFLDKSGRFRVDSRCEESYNMQAEDRFVLPPVLAYYSERWRPSFRPLPPWRKDCAEMGGEADAMNLIYPPSGGVVYVPIQLDGQRGAVVFRLVHRYPERLVYWHLDDRYLTATRHFHELELAPEPGKHLITLVDESGVVCRRSFTVIAKEAGR